MFFTAEEQPFDYRITFRLCVLTVLGIGPFSLYHLMVGDRTMALITGSLTLAAVVTAVYALRTRDSFVSNHVVVLLSALMVLLALYQQGVDLAYWLYLLVLVTYYMLPLSSALLVSSLSLMIALFLLVDIVEPLQFARIGTTLGLVTLFSAIFSQDVRRTQRRLSHLAARDPLTGAGNRRDFDATLDQVMRFDGSSPHPSSLIVIDLDHFKHINDTHGHAVGDEVLVQIANTIRGRVREQDRLFRFGGEEFVLLLPHTSIGGAARLAEQLRSGLAQVPLASGIHVTASFGVAERASADTAQSWFRRADHALYRAKDSGRNVVVAA